MSEDAIDASEMNYHEGYPIIDQENNKKTPQQSAATKSVRNTQLHGMGGVYCADREIALALTSDDSTECMGFGSFASN
jgi:hypothetical protein